MADENMILWGVANPRNDNGLDFDGTWGMAVVKFEEPTPVATDSPAYYQRMFGRLLAQDGGVLFYPFGAQRRRTEFAFYDEEVIETESDEEEVTETESHEEKVTETESHEVEVTEAESHEDEATETESLEENEREINENGKKYLVYAKSFTPKILFRGFTPDSGGGVDTRLNGPEGVIPHGFLGGKTPTSMWESSGLFNMINNHLDQNPKMVSDFSSWTQLWLTAVYFSEYLHNSEGRIAVLDTTSIEGHVWHSNDLRHARLSVSSYDDEYLIYGPVTGPNYHYVDPMELCRTTRIFDLVQGAQFVFGEDPESCAIERGAVESAMELAAAMQPRDASVENLALLTARFTSYRAARISNWHECMYYVDMDRYLYYTRDQIQHLALSAGSDGISLVDDTMFTGYRCLKFELNLLQAVENAVRVLPWGVRVAISRVPASTDGDRMEDVAV